MKKTIKITAVTVAVLSLAALMVIGAVVYEMFRPDTDPFGRRHPIPEGTAYLIPTVDTTVAGTGTLALREGPQGGIYRVCAELPELPAGELWVECRELTEDIPLSKRSIREKTSVRIQASPAGETFVSPEFAIHEGVWGEFYAARVRLCFRPCGQEDSASATGAVTDGNATAPALVIAESVYRVEGWQR